MHRSNNTLVLVYINNWVFRFRAIGQDEGDTGGAEDRNDG
jgi:hypothetical protein